jgi:preprotein translocase subunit YajC
MAIFRAPPPLGGALFWDEPPHMSFFTPAFAQTAANASAQPGGMDVLLQMAPFGVIILIMYFMMIRPQQRRAKEMQEMISSVRRGDTIVTTGGIIGKVTKAQDAAEVEVEIAPNVRVRIARPMIAEVRSKGEPVKADGKDSAA